MLLKYNVELPDVVLAFKLLDTARLDMTDSGALTACTDLTYASMKSALKRIFVGKASALVGSVLYGAKTTERKAVATK